VQAGKPQAIFISGEYGIGKTSLARYVMTIAEERYKLVGFHSLLGPAKNLEDLAARVVQSIIDSKAAKWESIKTFFSQYIEEISLFGIKVSFEKLQRDAHQIAANFLPYLRSVYDQIRSDVKGVILILDEINGLARSPEFGLFLKGLVDQNAINPNPLPLLLIICGTEERRREMLDQHEPLARIFEIADISPMTDAEMREFFAKSFASQGIRVEDEAMGFLCFYSGGLPKLMHLLGDAAFWLVEEEVLTKDMALTAVVTAAEEVGRKFINLQVYRAIRSEDYRRILKKIAASDAEMSFMTSDIEKGLSQEERKRFNNFLQKMKRLNVLRSGDRRGEYVFTDSLSRLYLRMESTGRPI
jgi:AAA+ ATPase superfamily predicted ATPase